jgi:hypothetical protein
MEHARRAGLGEDRCVARKLQLIAETLLSDQPHFLLRPHDAIPALDAQRGREIDPLEPEFHVRPCLLPSTGHEQQMPEMPVGFRVAGSARHGFLQLRNGLGQAARAHIQIGEGHPRLGARGVKSHRLEECRAGRFAIA